MTDEITNQRTKKRKAKWTTSYSDMSKRATEKRLHLSVGVCGTYTVHRSNLAPE